jgi:hypothetical protein
MKKTMKIHLVLVTAVLTSCNRMITPDQSDPGFTSDPGKGLLPDSSLTAGPVYDKNRYGENGYGKNGYDGSGYNENGYDQDRYGDSCRIDTVYSNNLAIYFNYFYPGRPYYYGYRFDYLHHRAVYWSNRLFIVRGGFGRRSASSAS